MEKKNYKKEKYKLNEPVLYPPLKKNIEALSVNEEKSEDLGYITLNFLKLRDTSIYKLLYNKGTASIDFLENKEIRNEYLKKIVESNSDYFPKELLLDKFKKRPDLSFEEKLKTKISLKGSEKISKKKEKKENDFDVSRKDTE